jgi:acyl-CoA synthetase (NDP forming)
MGIELDYIFNPRTIAVAGASESPEKTGHTYFKNVLENFPGRVYPVNIRAPKILGVQSYKSIRDLPENVDYVISAIPNRDVLDLVDACISKGAKVLHLFTARFSETGHEREAKLEQDMLAMAKRGGIRIIGPNCMGLYHPKLGISWGSGFPKEAGNVGIISQSGGNGSEIVSMGVSRGLRFSKVISYGNALDLNEADLIEYLAEDPETSVIGGYVEGVRNGPRFAKAIRYASRMKPVVLLKGGRTEAGTHMVSSHTASLAGERNVWEAMCKQAGAINTYSLDELLDSLVAFSRMAPASGFNVLVGGGAGGRSVLSADECEEEGLHLKSIPKDIRDELIQQDPFFGEWVTNPVDGSIMGGSNLRPHEVIETIAKSPEYDVVINNVATGGPIGGNDPARQQRANRILEHTVGISRNLDKSVALVMEDFLPETVEQHESVLALRHRCMDEGFAIFPSIGRASRAISRLVRYYRWSAEEKMEAGMLSREH